MTTATRAQSLAAGPDGSGARGSSHNERTVSIISRAAYGTSLRRGSAERTIPPPADRLGQEWPDTRCARRTPARRWVHDGIDDRAPTGTPTNPIGRSPTAAQRHGPGPSRRLVLRPPAGRGRRFGSSPSFWCSRLPGWSVRRSAVAPPFRAPTAPPASPCSRTTSLSSEPAAGPAPSSSGLTRESMTPRSSPPWRLCSPPSTPASPMPLVCRGRRVPPWPHPMPRGAGARSPPAVHWPTTSASPR